MKLINSLLLSKAIFALFAASTVSAQTCDQESCGLYAETSCYTDGCAFRSEDGTWNGNYAQCNTPDGTPATYCDVCYTASTCSIAQTCDVENCGSYAETLCYTDGCAFRDENGAWYGPYASCNSEAPPTYCDICFPTCSIDNDSSPSPTMTMMPTTYDSPSASRRLAKGWSRLTLLPLLPTRAAILRDRLARICRL